MDSINMEFLFENTYQHIFSIYSAWALCYMLNMVMTDLYIWTPIYNNFIQS